MTRDEIVPWLHHAGSTAGAIMFLIGAGLAFNPENGWGTRVLLFVPAIAFSCLLAGVYLMFGGPASRYLLMIGLLWLVIGITIHYNAGGGCIMWSLQGDGD